MTLDSAEPRADIAGIQALASRGAGYSVAAKCLQIQADAEVEDPSLRSSSSVRLHEEAWPWYVGALGEIAVGEMLARLGPQWFVRHAVPIGAGTKDVDHLVIGPGGVFAINTKHHDNVSVWIGDFVVKINTFSHRYVKQAQADGADVARRVGDRVRFPVPVTSVLAFLNAKSIKDGRNPDNRDVVVIDAQNLVAWLVAQPAQLSHSELELIKLASEEPETWHVDPRAADTFRVMQRFERLVSQVGPLPARQATNAPIKTRTARAPRRAPVPREMATRRPPRLTVLDLIKMWMGLGMPVVAILIFRDIANQPCASPVACMLPAFYLGLRPLLVLAVPALLGIGIVGTLVWMVRKVL